jgi:4-amino-4-deoxy-L-arabinose transferase-like glycosyltransferase
MLETLTLRFAQLRQYAIYQSIALPFVMLWIVLVWVISPMGEFPLNDDWIYTKTVEHLLATGQYKAHPYLNATLIAQSYWGALFCKIFGFSFSVLRVSTLALAFVNTWAVAKSGIALGFSRNLALLCGAIIATSPLVLQLSYSFMTDVPFLAMSNLSAYFFLKALRQPKAQFVAWGSTTGALAFLVRQFGILLPVAFSITAAGLIWRKRYVWTKAMTVAMLIPWAAVIGLYLGWGKALASQTPILESSPPLAGSIIDALRHVPVALCYLGLFTLPLGVSRMVQMIQGREPLSARHKATLIGFYGFSVLTFWLPQLLYWIKNLVSHQDALWLHLYPVRMPLLLYRSLLDFGLGPLQLPDPQFHSTVQLGEGWWLLTIAGLGVSGLLFVALLDRCGFGQNSVPSPEAVHQNPTHQNQDLFLASWALLSLAATYNPFRIVMVDRYLLVAIVPFILLLGRDLQIRPRRSLKPAMVSTILIAVLSVASLQEYMAWNRTAWAAHRQLETKYHVTPSQVTGIDTYNGWFNSEAFMERYHTQSWWDVNKYGTGRPWALDDQYVVASTEPRLGYQVLERIPYFSWLGWKERTIALFKRSKTESKKLSPL